MANRKLSSFGQMSSAILHERVQVPCSGIDYLSVYCYSYDAAWDAALIVTPEVSCDGFNWVAANYVDTGDGTLTAVPTWTANAMRRFIPVFEIPFFQVRVSTIGGTSTIKVFIYGEGEHSPLVVSNAADPGFGNPGVSQAGGQRVGAGTLSGGGFSGINLPNSGVS